MKTLLETARRHHDGHQGAYSNHESVTCPNCQFHVHVSADNKNLVQHWGTLLFVELITDEQQLVGPEKVKVVTNLSAKWSREHN